VENRGDVYCVGSDWGDVEDVTVIEQVDIIIQEDCARLDFMEHDVLLIEAD
jgi:hypothetical protein